MIRTVQIVKCDMCCNERHMPSYYTSIKLGTINNEPKVPEPIIRKDEFHLCPTCAKKLREFIEIPF